MLERCALGAQRRHVGLDGVVAQEKARARGAKDGLDGLGVAIHAAEGQVGSHWHGHAARQEHAEEPGEPGLAGGQHDHGAIAGPKAERDQMPRHAVGPLEQVRHRELHGVGVLGGEPEQRPVVRRTLEGVVQRLRFQREDACVDQKRCAQGTSGCAKIIALLCPPKPKESFMAARMVAFRATFGT